MACHHVLALLPIWRYVVGLEVAVTALVGATCHKDPTEPGRGRVAERWFRPQSSALFCPAPAVSDTTVYMADGGVVVARSAATGSPTWRSSLGTSETGGKNLIAANGVVVAAGDLFVVGLDAKSGAQLWRYEAPLDTVAKTSPRPGYVGVSNLVTDGSTVFIPAWGASVSAVDIRTGTRRWAWQVEPEMKFRSGSSGVAISGDTVFATVWHFLNDLGGRAEAWVVALDKQSGREFWRFTLPKESQGAMVLVAPAVRDDLVYTTISAGDLFAVSRRDRIVAWHVPPQVPADGFGVAVLVGPKIYGDVLYAVGSDQKLRAYSAGTGTIRWESAAAGLGGEMHITEKFIYGSAGPPLLMFARANGTLYSTLDHPRKGATPTEIFCSPAAGTDGNIYVTLSDGAWSFSEP